ncbi:hypothetical protein SUGI_1023830 [Cryptomeria japonica]|uniref:UDP-glycosyltransferase 85A5-like n=1 Tax=Cryptomeria japonica TaxID=3369 RepID=UPI0024146896|nr:UDP-glycosyltransferase 85A5-like [Cryptomeria japonica]GLJ48526.1 hypothetical protein SUGI_1023830 [Cryptomeria japonica]
MEKGFGGEKPHALVVPFPLQGHINPMLYFAHKLVSHGFLVTFVHSEHNQSRINEAKEKMKLEDADKDNIRLVSVTDALAPEESRSDVPKLLDSLQDTLASSLHKLIEDINKTEAHGITCAVFDLSLYYVRHVAKNLDIPYVLFSTVSVATCVVVQESSTLISSGIVSPNGTATVDKMINVLPFMPPLRSTKLVWMFGSEDQIKINMEMTFEAANAIREEFVVFNSFYDLEAPSINDYPGKDTKISTIGPLISPGILEGDLGQGEFGRQGNLRAEAVECLAWLDKQPRQSVIYVSFGSLAILNAKQFQELAAGLEATGRPFLWVVRSDLMDGTIGALPPGFAERVGDRGCLVSWAPQLSVLCHPSTVCFITHCGWNSTMESVSTGVPMLCWPSSFEQFLNCTYIVNEWKIGLELIPNGDGLVEKGEILNAVEKLLVGEEGIDIKKRATFLKERARESVKAGHSSLFNFNLVVETLRSKRI